MLDYPDTHQEGTLSIENIQSHIKEKELRDVLYLEDIDFGIQIAKDGRVWICINGISFLRFSPHPNGKMQK